MTNANETLLFDSLEALFLDDLDIAARNNRQNKSVGDIDLLCSLLQRHNHDQKIVYTAFDGDHFQLCGHMRRFVLSHGCVPANPESILGYKDTVTARLNKRDVLIDDITVLRGCDELWVFSDHEPLPHVVRNLAEGVVAELLYFLKRHGDTSISFVSSREMLLNGEVHPVRFRGSYEDARSALHEDQRNGVLDLANSEGRVDRELRTITYYIFDPMDFKYSAWLRSEGYGAIQVPLVPGLAIGVGDLAGLPAALGRAIASWTVLMRIAARAVILSPMDETRAPSALCALLERLWIRDHGAPTIERRTWREYSIPKARVGDRWPITKHEGGVR